METGAKTSVCVGCGAPGGAPYLEARSPRGTPLELLRCRACGHVFLRGWAGDFDAELYSYYASRVGDSRDVAYDPLNTKRHHELLATLAPRVKGRRFLDVGCGEGQLVHSATTAGWDARGIELSPDAVRVAQSLGANVQQLDFFAADLDDERFDVIAMTELIEHVLEPARFLRRAEELLAPGGLLYLTTPNFSALSRRLMGSAWPPIHPEHISYFTPSVLLGVVARHTHLELVDLETRNFDPRAVVHLVRPLRRRPEPKAPSGDVAQVAHVDPPRAVPIVQQARTLVEGSAALRALKGGVNRALSTFRAGETIVMTFRRGEAS